MDAEAIFAKIQSVIDAIMAFFQKIAAFVGALAPMVPLIAGALAH